MRKFILCLPLVLLPASFGGELYYYSFGKKITLQAQEDFGLRSAASAAGQSAQGQSATSQATEQDAKITYYKDASGKSLGVDNKILVKLHAGSDVSAIQERFGVKFAERLTQDLVIFKAASAQEAIRISAELVEQGLCRFAQPNTYTEVNSR
ncbi:MAG: hypothetical protein ACTTIC_01195 [Helicobacteraceae bacterium]